MSKANTSGRDAARKHGIKIDQYGRMGNQRTSPAPSRAGHVSQINKFDYVGGGKTRPGSGEGASRVVAQAG